MWQYVVLITIPFICQHIGTGKIVYKKRNDFAMKLFWGMLLVMLMLRKETLGNDASVYQKIFNFIDRSDWARALTRSQEVLWSFLNKCIAVLGGNFRWVIVVTALLSVWWVVKAYIKYSNDTSLSIVLFVNLSCFVLLFSGLRQSIAISIGFIAFEYAREKKLFPFLITVVVAMLFHTSAFMLLFMYPLYYVRIKKIHLLFIVPTITLVYLFNEQIFTVLGRVLMAFTDYDTTIGKTGSVTVLLLFIIFAIFSFIIPEESDLDADTVGMRNFLLLAVVMQMFAPLHHIAMRMNYYYIAFIPLLIPRIIQHRSNRWRQVAILARRVMVVFFAVYFFLTAPSDNVLHTFPYEFFWQNR